MADDPRISQAFALLSDAIADAYKRGKDDAIKAMLQAASGAMQNYTHTRSEILKPTGSAIERAHDDGRKRAPRGSAERVIKRALDAAGNAGATVADIMVAREGELEMMLVDSSIRGELRRGEKTTPMKYIELEGRWHNPNPK